MVYRCGVCGGVIEKRSVRKWIQSIEIIGGEMYVVGKVVVVVQCLFI